MEERMIKTHLIITDIHEEYHMNWCGKIAETQPAINEDGLPTFIIIGSQSRLEINTISMKRLEECAKKLTHPKGRSAVSVDSSHIYILEKNGNQKLIGVLTHRRIKSFAPMYDKIGYKS